MLKSFKSGLCLSGVVILSLVFLLAGQGKVEAAPEKTFKIGIVNIGQIVLQSQEGQTIITQLEKEANEKQKELEKLQDDVKRLQEDLEKQGTLLTEEKKKDKEESYVRKRRDLQRLYEDYNRDLNKRKDEGLNKVGIKVLQLIKDYGQEQGYALILDSNVVMYRGQEVDLTTEILKRFNAQKR